MSVFVFFFKQKTAYEMRISDWSSDVCSSDLQGQRSGPLRTRLLCARPRYQGDRPVARMGSQQPHRADRFRREAPDLGAQGQARRITLLDRREHPAHLLGRQGARGSVAGSARLRLFAHRKSRGRARPRKEEQTSELLSIMRNTYDGFGLKKKKQKTQSN